MSTTTLPDWLTVGAEVRAWAGDVWRRPGPVTTVDRFTATQIVLTDGTRFRRTDLTVVGRGDFARLYPAGAPGLAEAEERAVRVEAEERAEKARKAAAWRIQDLGPRWANYPTDENLAKLRAAVVALAPCLGLTVTDAPTDAEEDPS